MLIIIWDDPEPYGVILNPLEITQIANMSGYAYQSSVNIITSNVNIIYYNWFMYTMNIFA